MNTSTMLAMRRRTLFSHTLVLTALLVVAAAGSVFCTRSARASAPIAPVQEDASAEAQAVANLIAAQSVGNLPLGFSSMQVLWGGGIKDEPPTGGVTPPPVTRPASLDRQRVAPSRPASRVRKAASAKTG